MEGKVQTLKEILFLKNDNLFFVGERLCEKTRFLHYKTENQFFCDIDKFKK